MTSVPVAARLDHSQAEVFRQLTTKLGTTPGDAIRIFVAAFNAHRGFPFEVREQLEPEPFESEEEATEFATALAMDMIRETR